MTDLEFIRLRAARIGFELLVNDKDLFFRKRTDADSGITLDFGVIKTARWRSFSPFVDGESGLGSARAAAGTRTRKRRSSARPSPPRRSWGTSRARRSPTANTRACWPSDAKSPVVVEGRGGQHRQVDPAGAADELHHRRRRLQRAIRRSKVGIIVRSTFKTSASTANTTSPPSNTPTFMTAARRLSHRFQIPSRRRVVEPVTARNAHRPKTKTARKSRVSAASH